jgi:hypothetical protein
MITHGKVAIYKKYNGDIDAWARVGTKEEKILMQDNDWVQIEDAVQAILLIKNGHASDIFSASIKQKLKGQFDSDDTIQELVNGANF